MEAHVTEKMKGELLNWLIDGSAFPKYFEKLAEAVKAQGGQAVVVNRPRPPYHWDDDGSSYQKAFPAGANVIAHGDIDLVQRVAKEQRWTPGVFATIPNYFCSSYIPLLGQYLLNGDYMMLPLGDLHRCADRLFNHFGIENKVFVRPDSPLKLFTGMTISQQTFDKDLELITFYDVPENELILVSSPKTVLDEWRFVVSNRTVVAGAHYQHEGKLIWSSDYDVAALNLATTIASTGFEPDPVWILDICKTDDGSYYVLEIGCFSYSDLYACDKERVVKAVAIAMEDSQQVNDS